MTLHKLLLTTSLVLAPELLMGQGVTPADLIKPLKDSWPTYNGDYSGKRYSALTQINQSNVKQLTLAWMTRVTPGAGDAGSGRGARVGRATPVPPDTGFLSFSAVLRPNHLCAANLLARE